MDKIKAFVRANWLKLALVVPALAILLWLVWRWWCVVAPSGRDWRQAAARHEELALRYQQELRKAQARGAAARELVEQKYKGQVEIARQQVAKAEQQLATDRQAFADEAAKAWGSWRARP